MIHIITQNTSLVNILLTNYFYFLTAHRAIVDLAYDITKETVLSKIHQLTSFVHKDLLTTSSKCTLSLAKLTHTMLNVRYISLLGAKIQKKIETNKCSLDLIPYFNIFYLTNSPSGLFFNTLIRLSLISTWFLMRFQGSILSSLSFNSLSTVSFSLFPWSSSML